jgi:antitoxin (DNA-binding transcriptional repressor) of toxin-antitoxin stability system
VNSGLQRCVTRDTLCDMNAIQISVRELHARTGHYVRKAAEMPVVITDYGKPVAEIKPFTETSKKPYFARRKLLPGFKKLMESGALRPKPGDRDVTELISEDREDRRQ